MEDLPFFERIRIARPGFAELTEDETNQLAAYLKHLPRMRVSWSKQQQEQQAGIDTYKQELDTERNWRAHLRAVRDYNQVRIASANTSAMSASVTPAGVQSIADMSGPTVGPYTPDPAHRVPDSDRERYGELRRELERSAVRLEEDRTILFKTDANYSGGLNAETINRLAGRPIIVKECVGAGVDADRFLIVNPRGGEEEEPARWHTNGITARIDLAKLYETPPHKLNRTVRYLREWRNWAAEMERQAVDTPTVGADKSEGGTPSAEEARPLSRLDLTGIATAIAGLYRVIESAPQGPITHAAHISEAVTKTLLSIAPHTRRECPEITKSSLDQRHKVAMLDLRDLLMGIEIGGGTILARDRGEAIRVGARLEEVLRDLGEPTPLPAAVTERAEGGTPDTHRDPNKPSAARQQDIIATIVSKGMPLTRPELVEAMKLEREGKLGHNLAWMVANKILVNVSPLGYWPADRPVPK